MKTETTNPKYTKEQIATRLAELMTGLEPKLFRNKKTQELYLVVALSFNTERGEIDNPDVIYTPGMQQHPDMPLYARPLKDFKTKFDVPTPYKYSNPYFDNAVFNVEKRGDNCIRLYRRGQHIANFSYTYNSAALAQFVDCLKQFTPQGFIPNDTTDATLCVSLYGKTLKFDKSHWAPTPVSLDYIANELSKFIAEATKDKHDKEIKFYEGE